MKMGSVKHGGKIFVVGDGYVGRLEVIIVSWRVNHILQISTDLYLWYHDLGLTGSFVAK